MQTWTYSLAKQISNLNFVQNLDKSFQLAFFRLSPENDRIPSLKRCLRVKRNAFLPSAQPKN